MFSLYCNPDLDGRIFDCLLTLMAAVQADDVHASFLFVGDLNGNHQEWLGSATTNRHGVAVFGLSSSLPPLVGGGGGLVCETVDKADLLSDHFNGKQSMESVDLPLTCHLSQSLTSFSFRASEVRRLLLDLDPYGGSDPLGIFPLFFVEII